MQVIIFKNKILILTLLIPFFLYLKTLLPSLGFWDTAEFQTIPYSFDIGHPTGYPTYVLLGNIYLKIFPFGSVAWRLNLLSALYTSLALYILSLLLKYLTNNTYLSLLIPILLSINPYLWPISNKADVHSLHFLFTSIYITLLSIYINTNKRNILFLLMFITGLSIGNHMLSIFFIPPLLLVFLFRTIVHKDYVKAILATTLLAIGLSIYTLLPIISNYKEPFSFKYKINSVSNFKRHVLGEDFSTSMMSWTKGDIKLSFLYYFDTFKKSFPFYSWLLVIVGLFSSLLNKKWFVLNILLLIISLSSLYFSLRYQNGFLERYFLMSFYISSILMSYGFTAIYKIDKYNILKISSYIYIIYILIIFTPIHYRNNNENNNIYAYNWAKNTLSALPDNSTLLSWWSYSTPLWYLQKVEGYRNDINIINEGSNNWENIAINSPNIENTFLIEKINILNTNYKIISYNDSNIYKIVKKVRP